MRSRRSHQPGKTCQKRAFQDGKSPVVFDHVPLIDDTCLCARTLVSFPGVGIVPEEGGNPVNIHAKISGTGQADGCPVRRAPVSSAYGEAYNAYWNRWLRDLAGQARLKHPDLFRGKTCAGGDSMKPLASIEQLYRKRGGGAVFELARAMGRPSGFEVFSLVLTSARSIEELIGRWNGLLAMQAQVRFAEQQSVCDFVVPEAGGLVLSPHRVRPANLNPFGPAIQAGVAVATLEGAGLSVERVWSVPRGGAARQIGKPGAAAENAMDFDSDIVISLTGGTAAALAAPRGTGLDLAHLIRAEPAPGARRLVARVAAALEAEEGPQAGLPDVAASLGLSSRTLSRRLSEAGTGFARLARFVRLRKASCLLLAGQTCLDDIAYQAAYSDRHHLSRDFRKMAQVTPSGLRDLLA